MRVRNCSGRPFEVDRGRIVGPSEVVDVNSRHPEVARAIEAGMLRRLPPEPTGPTAGQEDDQ